MKCSNCGTEINKGVKFCPKCGADVSSCPPQTKKESKNKKDKEIKEYKLTDKEIERLSNSFVNRDEKYISSLGNGYIMNYLADKTMSKGFAFITNKRVYFKGSCLRGTGKMLVKTNEERTVDVKDITGSGFTYHRHLGSLIVGLLMLILSLGLAFGVLTYVGYDLSWHRQERQSYQDHFNYATQYLDALINGTELSFATVEYAEWYLVDEEQLERNLEGLVEKWDINDSDRWRTLYLTDNTFKKELQSAFFRDKPPLLGNHAVLSLTALIPLIPFMIAGIIILKNYLFKRKTLFRIEYAGGCIAFNVSFYAKAEIDDFQKQLRRAKDLAEESASKVTVTESPVQPSAQNSVPDDLRKYADLLKDGLISQEEYDAMKKKILNL